MRTLATGCKLATVCIVGLVACKANLSVDPQTNLHCTLDADCPSGWLRAAAVQRCFVGSAQDTTAPRLVSASAPDTFDVDIVFSEALAPDSVTDVGLYSIQHPSGAALPVDSVTVLEPAKLRLHTGGPDGLEQEGATLYTLAVAAGPTDAFGNALDPAAANTSFTGTGTAPERSPPTPISPTPGQGVQGLHATLVWTSRVRATSYTVEIATDAAFTQPIADSPKSTAATVVDVTLTQAVQHYWRVRADVTDPDQWGQSTFEAFDDAVYVACAAAADCSANIGNRGSPLGSIKQAMAVAATLKLGEVRIAGRPEPYDEGSLDLLDGVSLVGGYSSDFSSNDAQANVTTITGVASPAVQGVDLVKPMHLTGLTFVAANVTGSDASIALGLLDCGSAVEVHDCRFFGGTAESGRSLGVRVVSRALSAPGPQFFDSNATGGTSQDTTLGLEVLGANATLTGCTFTGGPAAPTSIGLRLENSGTTVQSCTLRGGDGEIGLSLGVDALSDVGLLIGNTVHGGTGTAGVGVSMGVRLDGCLQTWQDNDIGTAVVNDIDLSDLRILGPTALSGNFDNSTFTGGTLSVGTVNLSCTNIFACSAPSIALFGVELAGCGTHLQNVAISLGDVPASTYAVSETAVDMSSSVVELHGCAVNVGAFHGDVLVGIDASFSSGQITNTTVTLAGQSDTQATGIAAGNAGGLLLSASSIVIGAVQQSTGVAFVTGTGSVERNSISLGSTVSGSLGIDTRTVFQALPATLLLTNNLVRAGDASSGDSIALAIGDQGFAAGTNFTVLATNNTLLAGAASGQSTAVLLDQPVVDGSSSTLMPPFWLANNLFATSAGAGLRFCVSASTPAQQYADQALPQGLHNNAFTDCPTALLAKAAASGNGSCADTERDCFNAVGNLNNAAISSYLGLGQASGNVVFASLASLNLGSDFRPSNTTPAALTGGGLDASQSLCGIDGAQSCGAVSADLRGTPRNCAGPGDCYAIGALEP